MRTTPRESATANGMLPAQTTSTKRARVAAFALVMIVAGPTPLCSSDTEPHPRGTFGLIAGLDGRAKGLEVTRGLRLGLFEALLEACPHPATDAANVAPTTIALSAEPARRAPDSLLMARR